MSLVENINRELEAMTTGTTRALETAAESDNAAGHVAQRAAGVGFAGIAQTMARVREAIKEIHTSLTDVGQAINEARSTVAAAPKQMSPEQTITVLAQVSEKIATIHGGIGATIAKVNQTQQLTAATLQGGQPGPMLSRLGTIRLILEAVVQRCNTAKQHVEAALADARKTGEAKN